MAESEANDVPLSADELSITSRTARSNAQSREEERLSEAESEESQLSSEETEIQGVSPPAMDSQMNYELQCNNDVLYGAVSSEAEMEANLRVGEGNSIESTCDIASVDQDTDGVSAEDELSDDLKREKLQQLCSGVAILTRESHCPSGLCYVYLLGTAHVSQESCREVEAAISLLKPEAVFVELCDRRSFMLTLTQFQVPTASEMLSSWKEKRSNVLGILYSWFLAKVAAKMDVFPGSEFRVAYEEARKCGARVYLGDRDVQVTLKRTWGRMSVWYKLKFVFMLFFQAFSLPSVEMLKEMIQGLQDSDMLTLAFQELGKSFPTVLETLVHERDLFMTAVLHRLAVNHSSIVAVVGRGHLPGITKHWEEEISVDALMEVPNRESFWTKRKCYVLVPIMAAGVAYIVHAYYPFR